MAKNIFELASRCGLRFNSSKGLLTVEQLWSLPLQSASNLSLDGLAMAQHKKVKDSTELSFVTPTRTNSEDELKLDILKHIIEVRIEENTAKNVAAEKRARKEKIMEILADKKHDALKNMDVADLEKELASL